MICKNCGQLLPDDSRFCKFCGNPTGPAQPRQAQQTPPQTEPGPDNGPCRTVPGGEPNAGWQGRGGSWQNNSAWQGRQQYTPPQSRTGPQQAYTQPKAPEPAAKKKSAAVALLAFVCAVLAIALISVYFYMSESISELEQSRRDLVSSYRDQSDNFDAYEQLHEALSENAVNGFASEEFRVDRPVVIMRVYDDFVPVELTTAYDVGITVSWYGESPDGGSTDTTLEFTEDSWSDSTTFNVIPGARGLTVFTFSNDLNDETFQMAVLVLDQ